MSSNNNQKKRKYDDIDGKNDVQCPPAKKIKLNDAQTFEAKKMQIIDEFDDKIAKLEKEIKNLKQSKKDALSTLDAEFPDITKSKTNDKIPIPSISDLQVHFKSTQFGANNELEKSFTPHWTAELRIEIDSIFGFGMDCKSADNLQKLKNTFADLDINSINYDSTLVLGKASFYHIQMHRLCNFGWMDGLFTVLDAKCQEIGDLIEVLDISDDPGSFKTNRSTSVFASDPMNEGDIILIDRVEINKHFKGNKFGRCLVQRIADNFQGSTRIVVKPFPLQYERRRATSSSDRQKAEDQKNYNRDLQKVRAVWETMGFKQIGNSQFWGRSEACINPMQVVE